MVQYDDRADALRFQHCPPLSGERCPEVRPVQCAHTAAMHGYRSCLHACSHGVKYYLHRPLRCLDDMLRLLLQLRLLPRVTPSLTLQTLDSPMASIIVQSCHEPESCLFLLILQLWIVYATPHQIWLHWWRWPRLSRQILAGARHKIRSHSTKLHQIVTCIGNAVA